MKLARMWGKRGELLLSSRAAHTDLLAASTRAASTCSQQNVLASQIMLKFRLSVPKSDTATGKNTTLKGAPLTKWTIQPKIVKTEMHHDIMKLHHQMRANLSTSRNKGKFEISIQIAHRRLYFHITSTRLVCSVKQSKLKSFLRLFLAQTAEFLV